MKIISLILFLGSLPVFSQSVPCGSTAVPLISGLSVLTYTDSAISDNGTYYYDIAATDSLGNTSTCSNIVQAIIPSIGTHTVTLTWTASTGGTGAITYAVFRAQAPSPPTLSIKVN